MNKENKMYDYLLNHNYISKNKKINYQSELSIERAKCIANKFNSLVKDENTNLKRALNEIREYIIKRKNLGQAENLDYYVIRKDILQIIEKVLGGSYE